MQVLPSETVFEEIAFLPRRTRTRTLPLHPSACVTPVGSVSLPRVRNTNGGLVSRDGVTAALSLLLPCTRS